MCWSPIGWSFVRGKSQIAMVIGHVCQVVVGEGLFIQHSEKMVVKSLWYLDIENSVIPVFTLKSVFRRIITQSVVYIFSCCHFVMHFKEVTSLQCYITCELHENRGLLI